MSKLLYQMLDGILIVLQPNKEMDSRGRGSVHHDAKRNSSQQMGRTLRRKWIQLEEDSKNHRGDGGSGKG